MADIDDLTKLFGSAEVDPDGPQGQVNRLAEQLAKSTIQDTETADEGTKNEQTSWPQTGPEIDEFLCMAGFTLSDFQNGTSPYDSALMAVGVDPVEFRLQNSKSEWDNLVKQMDELEFTQAAAMADYNADPNHSSLPFSDDEMMKSMALYLASLPPMTFPMVKLAPIPTLEDALRRLSKDINCDGLPPGSLTGKSDLSSVSRD
jgi:hypothetical protein